MRTVVLVEGDSDRIALETLARRRDQDLSEVLIASLGGVTNFGRAMERYGPRGEDARLAGLYDAGEERYIRSGLARLGLGADFSRPQLASLGFFVCEPDLEVELICALGIAGTEDVLAHEGDLARFRTFQNQPFQRERSPEQQLHRFFGTTAGRKAKYAKALVDALDPTAAPRPLANVLDFASASA